MGVCFDSQIEKQFNNINMKDENLTLKRKINELTLVRLGLQIVPRTRRDLTFILGVSSQCLSLTHTVVSVSLSLRFSPSPSPSPPPSLPPSPAEAAAIADEGALPHKQRVREQRSGRATDIDLVRLLKMEQRKKREEKREKERPHVHRRA